MTDDERRLAAHQSLQASEARLASITPTPDAREMATKDVVVKPSEKSQNGLSTTELIQKLLSVPIEYYDKDWVGEEYARIPYGQWMHWAAHRLEAGRLLIESLRGAMMADAKRLNDAEHRIGSHTWGCDAPEHMADTIIELRDRLAALEATHNELRESINANYWEGIRDDNRKLHAKIRALEARAGEGDINIIKSGVLRIDGVVMTVEYIKQSIALAQQTAPLREALQNLVNAWDACENTINGFIKFGYTHQMLYPKELSDLLGGALDKARQVITSPSANSGEGEKK